VEISDDKVMTLLMDTNTKVTLAVQKLNDHCEESAKKHKSHDQRLNRLETEGNLDPIDKGVKYWSKKLAPWTAGVSLLAYILYDLYISLKGGG
jgi:hypothetical protein